jgi:hypothetical protein
VGNEADRKAYKAVELELARSRERALELARDRFLEHVVTSFERSIEGVASTLSLAVSRGPVTATDGAIRLEDRITASRRGFDTQLSTIEERLREQVRGEHVRVQDTSTRARWLLAAAAAVVLALGAVFTISLLRALKPRPSPRGVETSTPAVAAYQPAIDAATVTATLAEPRLLGGSEPARPAAVEQDHEQREVEDDPELGVR